MLLLDGQVHHDTHVIPMGNYVSGVGNYVSADSSNVGNYVSADTSIVMGIEPAPAQIGGSARVFLYERRSRAVVIGDAFRSRLEAGLAAWAASMSATAICRPRAPPLGHELPADE